MQSTTNDDLLKTRAALYTLF